MEDIILVDDNDIQTGTGEKMDVHRSGLLHRAFSVCIYNSKGEQLLQRRALAKYHCPGLWSNACCSHPRPAENLFDAAKRRLKEEMSIDYNWSGREGGVPQMEFIYKVKVGNLTEYEYDHVLFAAFDGEPKINKEEADGWRWIDRDELVADIRKNPAEYTPWFRLMMRVAWIGNDPKSLVPELDLYEERTKIAKK
ncbi:MAG TPA: isopentenyl-diphosphate Delta-isomerase [Candidatus Paceibacterota bacterium]|nr:isopentenyl-diphosphate Delta-isomerase [Candidatus Pacearchaeota archaeon]HRZ50749.1 isopentenyl-diphosphate Delta-isomerase [Candidatus Paceibacterota bacterium]HSA36354.1 isopentenyl-diphosphate Delta-isomerase [Candidatus Paceibacterota bacterium]